MRLNIGVRASFENFTFTGSRIRDKLSDRLSRQAILEEKIKKFFAVRVDRVSAVVGVASAWWSVFTQLMHPFLLTYLHLSKYWRVYVITFYHWRVFLLVLFRIRQFALEGRDPMGTAFIYWYDIYICLILCYKIIKKVCLEKIVLESYCCIVN